MKSAALLLSVAASASAQVIVTTDNECWLGQGGRFIDNCDDVYFLTCDNYEVEADSSCNVFTFSDSRLTWVSQEITVSNWDYYLRQDLSVDTAYTAKDFGESKEDKNALCYPAKETPSSYENGRIENYTSGMCGFKFQIINNNKDYPNKFKVLKDSALMVAAGSAAALTAILAF